MTHGLLSKCTILKGTGIVCLNMMFFHCLRFFFGSGYNHNTEIWEETGELNLMKRAFHFQKQNAFSKKTILE